MALNIKLEIGNLEVLRTVNPRMMSYNVEMTEVTGGTFWKAYTPEQIAGTEPFPPISGYHAQTSRGQDARGDMKRAERMTGEARTSMMMTVRRQHGNNA